MLYPHLWQVLARRPLDFCVVGVRLVPHEGQPVLQQPPEGRDVDHHVALGVSLDALLGAALLGRPMRHSAEEEGSGL